MPLGPPAVALDHQLQQVLATQPGWHDGHMDATREPLDEFSQAVLEAARRHDAMVRWDASRPPVFPLPMPGYGPGFPPLAPHGMLQLTGIAAPPGFGPGVAAEALCPARSPGDYSVDTTAGTSSMYLNTPPQTPMKACYAAEIGKVASPINWDFGSKSSKSKEMSPALKEIRSLMAATREEDEEAKVQAQLGAQAGAFLLSLVQEAKPNLEDEGIIEAKLYPDGARHAKVDGVWIGPETARFYCRHCRYWSNFMEAHIKCTHHQRNRDRNVEGRHHLEEIPTPSNSRWKQTTLGRQPWQEQDWSYAGHWTPVKGSKDRTQDDGHHDHDAVNARDERADSPKGTSPAPVVPPKPPLPWQLAWSQERNNYYYWNTETKEVQWECP